MPGEQGLLRADQGQARRLGAALLGQLDFQREDVGKKAGDGSPLGADVPWRRVEAGDVTPGDSSAIEGDEHGGLGA